MAVDENMRGAMYSMPPKHIPFHSDMIPNREFTASESSSNSMVRMANGPKGGKRKNALKRLSNTVNGGKRNPMCTANYYSTFNNVQFTTRCLAHTL